MKLLKELNIKIKLLHENKTLNPNEQRLNFGMISSHSLVCFVDFIIN